MIKTIILAALLLLTCGCSDMNLNDYSVDISEEVTAHASLVQFDGIHLDDYYIEEYDEVYAFYADKYPTARETVEYVNSRAYLTPYVQYIHSDRENPYLIMANKYHCLGSDYVPENLVSLDTRYGNAGYLNKEAYEAFISMYEAAKVDGMDLIINSPYRSYDLQVATYSNFLSFDPQDVVDTYSSRPGFSDHQSGLVLDILTPGAGFDDFHTTDEAKWLAENAHLYGFICRYPYGKDDFTKYEYEAWHYRYIGEEALKVHESGLIYDEYYEYYLNK